ncbi:MAG: hypothetical protein IPP48_07590 [Chitinophagaceae bacterium]|nr:hypothetical protein [Chitinophagaceae bacterium]
MKYINYKIKKWLAVLIISTIASCTKNDKCTYETNCLEVAPAGYMVGTMGSDPFSFNRVATIFKTSNNASAPIGNDWNDPALGTNRVQSIFPKSWVSDSIGQVFELL